MQKSERVETGAKGRGGASRAWHQYAGNLSDFGYTETLSKRTKFLCLRTFTGNVHAIRHPPIVAECHRPLSIGGFTLPFRHRPLQLERLFSCFEAVLHHLGGRPQRCGLQPLIFGKSPKIANSSAHCVFGAVNRKSVCADFISSGLVLVFIVHGRSFPSSSRVCLSAAFAEYALPPV